MPPRSVKRGGATAAGTRKAVRATRGSQKAQNQPPPEAPEELVRAEEVPVAVVEAKEEVKVEPKPVVVEKPVIAQEKPPVVEEKPVVVNQQISDLKSDLKLEANGLRSKFLVLVMNFLLGCDGFEACSLNFFFYLLYLILSLSLFV